VKISKNRLIKIIKEELEAAQVQQKSMRANAMEKIEEIVDDEIKEAILAYISSLEGGIQDEQ
tara:strand:+ start:572 stop:757 length:186 start_codon:yes stop_codon:yes gene_type:complete